MTERLRSSEIAIVALAALIAVGGLLALRSPDLGRLAAFAILIAASELFEVTLPNGARFPMGLAPALGLTLLGPIRPVLDPAGFGEVITAFTVGMILALGVRRLMRRDLMMIEASSMMLVLAAGTAAYAALRGIGELPTFDVERSPASTDLSIIGFGALFLTVLAVSTVLHAVRTSQRERVPLVPVARGALATSVPVHLSIMSVGSLLAVSYPVLRFWAFPLFLAPLAATQFAFRQFASIRRTYLQTIRALSKVPEMAGYTNPGHSTRVAQLSVAIAKEMGLTEGDVDEIEYGALLHDIGRVSIPDPAQATASGTMELAVVGAAIVRETGHFPRVAEMIERQHDPYRRRGESPNATLPLGAKIIKVASAYDDHTRPGGIGESPIDVVDRLSVGMAFDYDPEVVQALRRVLEKQGVL